MSRNHFDMILDDYCCPNCNFLKSFLQACIVEISARLLHLYASKASRHRSNKVRSVIIGHVWRCHPCWVQPGVTTGLPNACSKRTVPNRTQRNRFDASLHQLNHIPFIGTSRGLGCSRPHVEGERAQVDENMQELVVFSTSTSVRHHGE